MVIHAKEFLSKVLPKDVCGRLEYDTKMIEELDMKLTGVLRNICKNNPPAAQPTPKRYKGGPQLRVCCPTCNFFCGKCV